MQRFLATPARRWSLVLTATTWSVAIAVVARIAWAELDGPLPQDRQVALAVASLVERGHLLQHTLDDEISARCLDVYLKMLDPMKLYFYQADVDGFAARKNDLDELAKKGDVSFGYEVFKVFLQRVDERVRAVDDLVNMDHDFTVDEDMVTDRDVATYAVDEADAREKWRKRIKYDLLMQKAEKRSAAEARDRLSRRYHSFARRMHQTDRDELLEMYLSALTTAYDPHTSYMSPATLENFEISMRLQLEGIGAALQSEDGYTVVNKIIPGGAADKEGHLRPQDRIIGVGQGENGEVEDVVEMKLADVVKKIRGKRGTVVRLQVIPTGGTTPQTYNITRAQIELRDSEARSQIFERGEKPNGEPYKLGVIDLPSFYMDMAGARQRLAEYKSTTRDVRRILQDFRNKGVDAVVMDLRRNGGGSLTEAIHLTGLFIDQGTVVQVKGADGDVQHHDDMDQGVEWDGPLVVLISKLSASASEIFAGAIQDYGRGLVVGDHATHGKGTVQTLRELGRELFLGPNRPSLGALKITMQQFYRPNGDSTQNRGVLSDIELPSLTSHWDVGESDLDFAMEFDRVAPADYSKLNLVDRAMLDELQRRSRERRKDSADFQKVEHNIVRYEEQKKKKSISLNEAEFMAMREAAEQKEDGEQALDEFADEATEGIKETFYLSEVLEVSVDYLALLTNKVAQAN